MFPHTRRIAHLLPRFPVVKAALSAYSLGFGRRTVAHGLKACQYVALSMKHNKHPFVIAMPTSLSLPYRGAGMLSYRETER